MIGGNSVSWRQLSQFPTICYDEFKRRHHAAFAGTTSARGVVERMLAVPDASLICFCKCPDAGRRFMTSIRLITDLEFNVKCKDNE